MKVQCFNYSFFASFSICNYRTKYGGHDLGFHKAIMGLYFLGEF